MAGGVSTSLFFAVILASSTLVSAESGDASLNPIRKIVSLLQEMQTEVDAEGKKDKELYEKFMCFCDNGVGGLQKTISDAKAGIEDNSARIEEEKSEKAQLEQDLVQHTADREQAGTDLQKASAIRNKEKTTFDAEYADATTNLDAVSKAVPALEAGLASSSLVQLGGDESALLQKVISSSQAISSLERNSALAFLSGKTSDQTTGSGEIVGILKTMMEEMKEDKEKLEQAEDVSGKGFGELKQAKDQEVKLATQAIEQKQKRVGELGVSVAQRTGSVEDAEDEQADAEKMITTMDRDCATKKEDFAARQKTRTEEVAAISEAINVLNDDDALDVFKKSVPSAALVQQDASSSKVRKFGFLQGRAMNQVMRLQKASEILATVGGFYKSSQLGLIAYSTKASLRAMVRSAAHGSQAQGGAVDFSQITKSIDEMIAVLNSESTDDEKHKEWCRGEFDKAGDETKGTQDQLSSLTAGMEEMSDEIAQWTEDIKTLDESIKTTDKEVAQATEQRKEEHEAYLTSVQLSQAAVALLKKAKNRLVKFYNPALYVPPAKEELSAEDRIAANLGGSLIQKHSARHHTSSVAPMEGAPDTMEGSATPNKKSGGVLQLMDMMTHELEMDSQQVEHEEKTAQTDYVELMGECQATRETDSKSVIDKTEAKANLESKLTDAKENKMNTF